MAEQEVKGYGMHDVLCAQMLRDAGEKS